MMVFVNFYSYCKSVQLDQNLIMALLIMTFYTVLSEKLYTILR